MAKAEEEDWSSCVKVILSATQTPFSNNYLPYLVRLIAKRYLILCIDDDAVVRLALRSDLMWAGRSH